MAEIVDEDRARDAAPALYATGRQKVLAHLAMLLFAALVSGSYSLGAIAAPHLGPSAINAVRFALAVALLGVGGSLDFITGRAVRAPQWAQDAGLEWLYRLYKEPWRWRRMLALPRFGWRVLVR